MKTCESCSNEHLGNYGSGRFCNVKCSRSFSTKAKRLEINSKVSKTLSGNEKDVDQKLKLRNSHLKRLRVTEKVYEHKINANCFTRGGSIYNVVCRNCLCDFETTIIEQEFCSSSCTATFNQTGKRLSDKHKNSISEALKEKYKGKIFSDEERKILSLAVGSYTKGKFKSGHINSIWDGSSRTRLKILKRLNCSTVCVSCGWDKDECDVHHIRGRKIENPHAHSNLILLCPNCHRLVHKGKLSLLGLKTLEDLFPSNWKDMYFG